MEKRTEEAFLHGLSQNLMCIIRLMPHTVMGRLSAKVSSVKQALFTHYFNLVEEQSRISDTSSQSLNVCKKIEILEDFSKDLDADSIRKIEKLKSFCAKKSLLLYYAESSSIHQDEVFQSEEVNFSRASSRKIYPILSIDGGGIRGIIPAKILVEIEKVTKKPISNLFHPN